MKLSNMLLVLAVLTSNFVAASSDSGTPAALRDAVADLIKTHGKAYPKGGKYLEQINSLGPNPAPESLAALRREALLANPLLDFGPLMFVRRNANSPKLGLPQNWQGNCSMPRTGYQDNISVIQKPLENSSSKALFQSEKPMMIADIDLHFDGQRMLFSMLGSQNRWQIWEIQVDGSGLRQVTPGDDPDVDNYDSCYLPNGDIIFASTRVIQGVPCVGGSSNVATLFSMKADGSGIRQLCFDQDHTWCPTVLNNGRVLYTRWEYSDTPHYYTRNLMHMNPDGTGQTEFYGSNSYWPNSLFFARSLPGSASKVAAIVSGHHGVPRMGELVILDSAISPRENAGVVQRIPGRGVKVPAVFTDALVNKIWPKFLHPWPLDENHLLVSCQPSSNAPWGIYLADTFDNLVLLAEEPGQALLEPMPLKARPTPPIIPARIHPESKESVVYLSDIYVGDALADVPRGIVKSLRVVEPHYAYPGMGGHMEIGIDGPWDVKRIHGTVPVSEEGAASFVVPANTPLLLQPLDADGGAVQLMRSWFTAMPGESRSCVGCHEPPGTASPYNQQLGAKPPDLITPWLGPARGFSFRRDVQPVLDRHCVSCHDGTDAQPSLLSEDEIALRGGKGRNPRLANFTSAYVGLHPYVRRPGPESDLHLLNPLEYHHNTSELIQMLRKGHHGVQLEHEDLDRLITWIDLNVPDHGTWGENKPIPRDGRRLRMESRAKYANLDVDPEQIHSSSPVAALPRPPKPAERPPLPSLTGWPLDAASAARLQQEEATRLGVPIRRTLDLGDDVKLDLALVPPGAFVMGSRDGSADESPASVVKIQRAFWIGTQEITNQQFALFRSSHDSGYISQSNKDHVTRGLPVNQPKQPVLRVSWNDAMAFCAWLGTHSGETIVLPDEAHWEYAARAGTATALPWGAVDADFSLHANLADAKLNDLTIRNSPDWIPAIMAINDGAPVTTQGGRYRANAWGLHDMQGNAAEWTLSIYRPYPYQESDGRNDKKAAGERVLRGGSYYDRPHRASSAFRLSYPAWQRVHNAGFRVVMEIQDPSAGATTAK